jgi:hypothetical protein
MEQIESIPKEDCTTFPVVRNDSSSSAAVQIEHIAATTAIHDEIRVNTDSTILTKRHVGRAARQRRRKWKEIRLLEDSLRAGNIVVPVVLPVDRDRVSPMVLQLRAASKWNAHSDGMALQAQLGYIPGNATRIVARVNDVVDLLGNDHCNDDSNTPVAVQLYPLVCRDALPSRVQPKKSRKRSLPSITEPALADPCAPLIIPQQHSIMEPFPTLYWLTHPLLRCLVSKLELEGYGMQLERRLQQDTTDMALMRQAHQAYGTERWNLLSFADQEWIRHQHWEAAVASNRGVAGIRNFGAVKCLHAHLAHYLSQGSGSMQNRVGQWVWEELMARYKAR